MLPSMTAQGWRKRQIANQTDQTMQEARIQVLEEEKRSSCADQSRLITFKKS